MQQFSEVGRSQSLAPSLSENHRSLLKLFTKQCLNRLFLLNELQQKRRLDRRQRCQTTFVKLLQVKLNWLQPGQESYKVTKQLR